MSKIFTVKEVAAALGMTPRGVVQRLNRNQLKGTRKTNQFGTAEWQVYATREITQAIEALRANPGAVPQQSFAADSEDNYEDSIDAEDVEVEGSFEQADWIEVERRRLEILAETLVRPLTEQLMMQAAALRDKELQLEDKDRQLRLLPDLQKRAEDEKKAAEAERKAAEERALEVIALKKQVSALKVIKDEVTSTAAALELQKHEVVAAQNKVQELETALDELRKADQEKERQAEADLQKLKAEKEKEGKALEEENERLKLKAEEAVLSAKKLEELEKVVQELQKPKPSWWRKLWMPSTEQDN